jgi:DNA polymerase/3'-5' exonuclease PolX
MTNHEIARRFERIGDILEIQGENPFKVKAYRRAAEAIDNLVEPLADMTRAAAFREIAGFGEAIIAKTRDFLQTGTTKLWEQVKDAVPPGVLAMAAVRASVRRRPKRCMTRWALRASKSWSRRAATGACERWRASGRAKRPNCWRPSSVVAG